MVDAGSGSYHTLAFSRSLRTVIRSVSEETPPSLADASGYHDVVLLAFCIPPSTVAHRLPVAAAQLHSPALATEALNMPVVGERRIVNRVSADPHGGYDSCLPRPLCSAPLPLPPARDPNAQPPSGSLWTAALGIAPSHGSPNDRRSRSPQQLADPSRSPALHAQAPAAPPPNAPPGTPFPVCERATFFPRLNRSVFLRYRASDRECRPHALFSPRPMSPSPRFRVPASPRLLSVSPCHPLSVSPLPLSFANSHPS